MSGAAWSSSSPLAGQAHREKRLRDSQPCPASLSESPGRLAGGDPLRAGRPGADCGSKEQARHPDRAPVRRVQAHLRRSPAPTATNPNLKVFSTLVMDAATARELLE